jgi:hypothetical protein
MNIERHNAKGILPILCCLLFSVTEAHAALELKAVYPTLGEVGKNLDVTLRGTGFDGNTKISMYLDVRNERKIVGAVNQIGNASGVAVSGDIAYVATTEGLQVIYIRNTSSPHVIGVLQDVMPAYDVVVSGNYAYVTDDIGIRVVNISDPAKPYIQSTEPSSGSARDISVSGNYVYVIDRQGALQIYDVSDPVNLILKGTVGETELEDAQGVALLGDYAYVSGKDGLSVIDISNPESPHVEANVPTGGDGYAVTVSENYAYIADGSGGLNIFNISDPLSPAFTGSVMTPGSALDVTVSGDYVYVSCGSEGVYIVNDSDPLKPKITGFVNTPGSSQGVVVSGDYAYVADDSGGLQIIDINNVSIPQSEISLDTPGDIEAVTVSDNYVFAADGHSGIQVINISEPLNPQIAGSGNVPGYAKGIALSGNYVYVASGYSGLQVADISDPANPELKPNGVNTQGYAEAVAVSGNYAYVAAGAGGLVVIDITDPENPQIAPVTVKKEGYAEGIAVSGRYAYVAYGLEGIQIVDISDPANSAPAAFMIDTPGSALSVAAVGDYVFVAANNSGLQIINISDPAAPHFETPMDTPGDAYHITIAGNYAFVADDRAGLMVININNPTVPQIIGYLDTRGYAKGAAVSGDYVFVADSFSGLAVVPKPVEITPVTLTSDTSLSLSLPGPSIAGHYTLRVFNESESDELPGAVTFEGSAFVEEMSRSKAIIVAGYGPANGNVIWEATQKLANFAYRTLIYQGYTHKNIYYLSPLPDDVDGDGQNDVDGDAIIGGPLISGSLSYAINTWARESGPPRHMTLYMADHGGPGIFQLQPDEALRAVDLDAMLDGLQADMTGRLLFIYEACNSGSFIHLGNIDTDQFTPMMTPPDGKERIIITSSAWNERAIFLQGGRLTFSYQFLSALNEGKNVADAFQAGDDAVRSIPQSPGFDADGDGKQNTASDTIGNLVIGRGYRPASDIPVISSISPSQTIHGDVPVTIWSSGIFDADGIEKVWATVVPPDFEQASTGVPITELPVVVLTDPDQDGKYEGVFDGFTSVGTYRISFYAIDIEGDISAPESMTIYQMYGRDAYEVDNTYDQAGVIVLNDPEPQKHNFYDSGDEDWVRFYGIAGQSYSIRASRLEVDADVVLELYGPDGILMLAQKNTSGVPHADELLEWQCPSDGIYYVRSRQQDSNKSGKNTGYELQVYQPAALSLLGILTGTVTNIPGGTPLGNVLIKTAANISTISTPTGTYIMFHTSGTYALEARNTGYETITDNFTIAQGQTITKNIAMTALCIVSPEVCDGKDNDCDGTVDENLTLDTTCGVGECASSRIKKCTAGAWSGESCIPKAPTVEVCDNLDNDCDGAIDENVCDDAHSLKKGFNLISSPTNTNSIPDAYTFFGLIDSAGLKVSKIQRYNKSGGVVQEAYYKPDGSKGGDNFPMIAGEGLVVYVKENMDIQMSQNTCPVYDLKTGTNWAGTPCDSQNASAFAIFEALGGEAFVSSIQRYNTDTGKFETASYLNSQPTGINFVIKAGEGYFIYMKQDVKGFNP